MNPRKRHGIWLINVLLAVVLAAAWWLQREPAGLAPGQPGLPNLDAIPRLLGDRLGRDLPLDLFETQLFAGGTSLKRDYRPTDDKTAPPVWLLAVQTFADRHAHHPPEYCYTGSGWRVEQSATASWDLGPGDRPTRAVVSLTQTPQAARELVAYWFTDGRRFAASYFERVLLDAWDRVRGRRASWILLRVSTPIADDADLAAADARVAAFSRRVDGLLRPHPDAGSGTP